MQGVTILGSTGSIGISTLDVIARHSADYQVVALTAHRQVERLYQQCVQYQPDYAVMLDVDAATQLATRLKQAGLQVQVLSGMDGLLEVCRADSVDVVMAAIVGAAGLMPTLTAVQSGKRVLLANKEALVMSGHLFMDAVVSSNAVLLPIDSEHNAIFQCLPTDYARGLENVGVEKILLTGSGGPFRQRPLAQLHNVTPDEACAHPTWSMGRKISVDSATMMNKGLELIEACWLFGTTAQQVEVVIHPQSVIHSMVAYVDGSVLAQMGQADMRISIAHALAWPQRIHSGVARLDIFDIARLDFEKPDSERFPCLRLAREVAHLGGTAPAILNAANEVAVAAFLDGKLPFIDIAVMVESVLGVVSSQDAKDLDIVLQADQTARHAANDLLARQGRRRSN